MIQLKNMNYYQTLELFNEVCSNYHTLNRQLKAFKSGKLSPPNESYLRIMKHDLEETAKKRKLLIYYIRKYNRLSQEYETKINGKYYRRIENALL